MQRIVEIPSHFMELPSEIILEILSYLEPKFAYTILSQINKQWHSFIIDALFWKNKIEKHFPDYYEKNSFNKSAFKKIEAINYPNFSEEEKELLRLIKENDIKSLENLPFTLEMLDKKDKFGNSILLMAQKVHHLPVVFCLTVHDGGWINNFYRAELHSFNSA